MRRVNIDHLIGNEILAKSIYTSSDNILLSEGIQIKLSYVSKLKEIGLEYIYVEDEISQGIEIKDYINEDTRTQCKQEVKRVLEKFSTSGKIELDSIAVMAKNIINEILDTEDVLICITDIYRRDEFTYSHSVSVCTLSVLLAIKRGYSPEKAKELAIGALLHDLGKAVIPDEVLNKKETLTPQEEEIFRQHVIHGYDAIKDRTWISNVSKNIILTHHERINGTGYPFGWTDTKIPEAAKIVGICDEFDMLIHIQNYKIYEAIEYLMAMKGVLFEADLVTTFINYIAVYPSGTGVITNSGDYAIVTDQNKGLPTRPIIRLLKDRNGNLFTIKKEIDLARELTVFITDTYEI